jgi:hypothetical protein
MCERDAAQLMVSLAAEPMKVPARISFQSANPSSMDAESVETSIQQTNVLQNHSQLTGLES